MSKAQHSDKDQSSISHLIRQCGFTYNEIAVMTKGKVSRPVIASAAINKYHLKEYQIIAIRDAIYCLKTSKQLHETENIDADSAQLALLIDNYKALSQEKKNRLFEYSQIFRI